MRYASRLVALAFLLLALTACGGGGGGGGGGSNSGNNVGGGNYYKSMVAGNQGSAIGIAPYDDLLDVAAEDATTIAYQGTARMARSSSNPMEFSTYEDDVVITRTVDGVQLVVNEDFNDLPARTINWNTFKEMNDSDYQAMMTALEVDPEFIGSLNSKYLVSTEVSHDENIHAIDDGEVIDGNVSSIDMLLLGGKASGLEFSDFGGWQLLEFFKGTIDGQQSEGYSWSEFHPVWNGDNSKTTGVIGLSSGEAHFSGKVIGGAITSGTSDDEPPVLVSGNASLDLQLNSGTMNFEAAFEHFYKFNITNIPVDGTSGATNYHTDFASGAQVTAIDNGNTTAINLSGKTLTLRKFNSQFYGSTAGQASEAVGSFDIRSGTVGGYERLVGAFGVKR